MMIKPATSWKYIGIIMLILLTDLLLAVKILVDRLRDIYG